jgi:hypothetical protein
VVASYNLGHAMDRTQTSRNGQIRADAMGQQALIDDASAIVETEVHLPVSSIEPDSRLRCFSGFRHQSSITVEGTARIGGEIVCEDIALFQQRQQASDYRGIAALLCIADVDHRLDASLTLCPFRQARHLHPIISSAGDTIRALIPWMSPLCRLATRKVPSRSMLPSAIISGIVARPVWQMCINGIISV